MCRIPSVFLAIAWGLWFGGIVVLFIAVSAVFGVLQQRHDLAGTIASRIFLIVNRYQIGLAAVAVTAAIVQCARSGTSRAMTWLLSSLAAASIALVIVVWLAWKINFIRLNGDVHSPEFARLHGLSMGMTVLELIFLLVAGFLMPAAISPNPQSPADAANRCPGQPSSGGISSPPRS